MNKKTFLAIIAGVIIGSLSAILYLSYVDKNTTTGEGYRWGQQGGRGQTTTTTDHAQGDCLGWLEDIEKGELSEKEKEDLLFMREEEKLARDVYIKMYEKWGEQIFNNISKSEQRHMDTMKALIDRYGLEDPVKDDSVGKFTNPDLAKLYNELVAQGEKSLIDALKVGATIEDVDIRDLNNAIANTDNEDIKLAYENLRSGSYNHMRAFVGQLKKLGSDYSPQFISVELYNQILEGLR